MNLMNLENAGDAAAFWDSAKIARFVFFPPRLAAQREIEKTQHVRRDDAR